MAVVIPSVQFTEDGQIDTDVSAMVKTLTDAGMSGWILWAWLCMPTGLLSDGIPCEVVKANPERAFTAASCAAEHHATPSWKRKRTTRRP